MRTSLLAGITTRGSSFLAAGVAAACAGFVLGERDLLCVGIALVALPVLAAAAARRGQYRLGTSRIIRPPRVPAGHTATVTLRLENVSRVPTGLLLAEDGVPYALGSRPRYVLDKIERNGVRELTYPLRSDVRGKFEIGPLQLRVADAFGLVQITRSLSGRTTFIVTPRVVPLARTVISRSWAGEGEGRARLASTAGEDDVIPRAYRHGDELRRVHWRSTARYGELMVRREEQRWRNRATVLLDSRSMSHMGTGAGSSFELAVSAAASVGVHVCQEGLTGQFITDNDMIRAGPFFDDRLLDALAMIRPSSARTLDRSFKELKVSGAGVIIAVMGKLSTAEASQLAACRTEGSQGIALLLDVATWADAARRAGPRAPADLDGGSPGGSDSDAVDDAAAAADAAVAWDTGAANTGAANTGAHRRPGSARSTAETAAAAAVLRSAGWHVTTMDVDTPLPNAWQRLPRAAEMLVATGTTISPGTGSGRPA
ncbi:MAG TPA: DUF58 domain-containing protein [Streptosporangiaceae bacterium]|nr:DUF58 domain-containing protein [Streptosporangiaceae bacterium]